MSFNKIVSVDNEIFDFKFNLPKNRLKTVLNNLWPGVDLWRLPSLMWRMTAIDLYSQYYLEDGISEYYKYVHAISLEASLGSKDFRLWFPINDQWVRTIFLQDPKKIIELFKHEDSLSLKDFFRFDLITSNNNVLTCPFKAKEWMERRKPLVSYVHVFDPDLVKECVQDYSQKFENLPIDTYHFGEYVSKFLFFRHVLGFDKGFEEGFCELIDLTNKSMRFLFGSIMIPAYEGIAERLKDQFYHLGLRLISKNKDKIQADIEQGRSNWIIIVLTCYLDHNLSTVTQEDDIRQRLTVFLTNIIESKGNLESNKQCVCEIIAMLIGGSDTLASAISSVLTEIEVNAKVKERLSQIRPQEREGFVEAIIYETLRLHPPTKLIGKKVIAPIKELNLSKNDLVLIDISILHRSQKWISPDAFDPNRFHGNSDANFTKEGLFIPFKTGPRNCAGKLFAINLLKSLILEIYGTFNVQRCGEIIEEKYKSPMSNFRTTISMKKV